jgi:hypothetical protein
VEMLIDGCILILSSFFALRVVMYLCAPAAFRPSSIYMVATIIATAVILLRFAHYGTYDVFNSSHRAHLSSRSLGTRLESPPYQQGVTKGGFRACVYVGAGSAAGSATEMIFLGADMVLTWRPQVAG